MPEPKQRGLNMDIGNPWTLISGLVIGLVGMVLFMYGKREQNLRALGAGVVLCVYPYFVASVVLMWVVFALVLGAAWALGKYE